jgi:hypothetical protein
MGAEEWRNHLMKVFNKMRETDKSARFGDAMKEAAKTYNKQSQNGGKRKVRRRSRRTRRTRRSRRTLRNTKRRRKSIRRRSRKSSRRSRR